MTSDEVTSISEAAATDTSRARSTIEFPYLDLDSAIEVAQAVFAVGVTSCDWDQLAGKMNHTASGGGFRMRVMTARTFGLLTYDRGFVTLTDLGSRIVDAKHSKAARAEAFQTVPLFRAAFDRMKGQALPPPPAIERMLEQLGVAPKQKDKARQVFMRSAKQAGFFEIDGGRLLLPPTSQRQEKDIGSNAPPPAKHNSGGGGDDGGGVDPLIIGLIKRLPSSGSDWPIAARIKWLQAAANNFDLIYTHGDVDDDLKITISRGGAPQ